MTGLNKKSYGFDNHQQGMGGLWTGSRMLPEAELSKPAPENAALADGASIDQAVAQATKGSTRFDSLQFQVDRTSTGGLGPGWMTGIYSGPAQPILGENSPYKMFNRVFEGFTAATPDEAVQRRAERKSVLDRVAGELSGLSTSLGKSDRAKLDQHLTHVRSIEKRLVDEAVVGPSCEPNALGSKLTTPKDPLANANYPEMVRLQTDIAMLGLGLRFDARRESSVLVLGQRPRLQLARLRSAQKHARRDRPPRPLARLGLERRVQELPVGHRSLVRRAGRVPGQLAGRGAGRRGHPARQHLRRLGQRDRARRPLARRYAVLDRRRRRARHAARQELRLSRQQDPAQPAAWSRSGRGMGLTLDKFGTSDEGSGGLPGFV